MFLHFFGLLLDRTTALDLVIADALDTHQVRIIEVDGLRDEKRYFIAPRGTIAIGHGCVKPVLRGITTVQRFDENLVKKCAEHVRLTLGHGYRTPYVTNDLFTAPVLMCEKGPQSGWHSFLATDARDISVFELDI
jgi:hypothetical protein